MIEIERDEESLRFACGASSPAEQAVFDAGLEPHGYFWANVIDFIEPDLAIDVELDPSADTFIAYGDEAGLDQLQALLTPIINSAAEIKAILARADEQGTDLS